MEIIKAFCIAFSIYSKIPMPQFEWEEKDMRYHCIFFPFVGVVIGGLLYLWNYICLYFGIGTLTYTCIGTAIPVILTGGFHIDGFMDTMDAFKSYKSKEEKLKIMQDAQIGAFSVIMLAAWGLCYMGAFSYFGVNEIEGQNQTFLQGYSYGYRGYQHGEVETKRYLEKDFLEHGVWANKVDSVIDLIIVDKTTGEKRVVSVDTKLLIEVNNKITYLDGNNYVTYQYDRDGEAKQIKKEQKK